LPGPEFPAAKTTVMLLSCAVFAAMATGSSGLNGPLPPYEFEMTRML
jgi:hypothetical protein